MAVHRGRSPVWSTAAASSARRSPAATSASTTRPATPRSCRPRWSGVLGVIDDVTAADPDRLRRATGDVILLLGETRDELAGSAWADVVHGHLGGRPPTLDLAHEQRLAGLLVASGPSWAAHQRPRPRRRRARPGPGRDRAATRDRRHGVIAGDDDPFVALFSESTGRVLVSLPASRSTELLELTSEANLPVRRLGVTGRRCPGDRGSVQPEPGRDPDHLAGPDPRRHGRCRPLTAHDTDSAGAAAPAESVVAYGAPCLTRSAYTARSRSLFSSPPGMLAEIRTGTG